MHHIVQARKRLPPRIYIWQLLAARVSVQLLTFMFNLSFFLSSLSIDGAVSVGHVHPEHGCKAYPQY